jgi:hypothetical protein
MSMVQLPGRESKKKELNSLYFKGESWIGTEEVMLMSKQPSQAPSLDVLLTLGHMLARLRHLSLGRHVDWVNCQLSQSHKLIDRQSLL